MIDAPCRFCDLWQAYARVGSRHYDDDHAPWPALQTPVGVEWRNIVPAPPSALALAHAATPPPAERCAKLGLAPRVLPLVPLPNDGRRLSWLHVPKAGSSFGTTAFGKTAFVTVRLASSLVSSSSASSGMK